MRTQYEEQLKGLHDGMLALGQLCQDVIGAATHALFDADTVATEPDSDLAYHKVQSLDELSENVFRIDREIDRKEREVESLCLRLLLLQQPVASDLRRISSALKMISDMERIGDQSSDIAELVPYIRASEWRSRIHLREMSKATSQMVSRSIEAYVKGDVEEARAVIASDDIVDNHFREVRQLLIAGVTEKRLGGEECVDLLMIAKYFERIGDHATNIAEWVEFSVTGVHRKYD